MVINIHLIYFLEVDPENIDVNVHPTKHEIRFLNQREVHEFVRHYAKETLAQFQTASADLAQAMKADESSDYSVQPQPKYQEQFSLHRANETLNSDSEARTQPAPTELLTDF